jgi:2-polyprenyl-3-methyl-5-hydroxy-6-metoxy-1,4-benzoquinol methylase
VTNLRSKNKIIEKEIQRKNPWYIEDQFVSMQHPSRRFIIEKRYRFISECIKKVIEKMQRTIKVLDAGCGDGYWLYRLNNLSGTEFTGIDYNPLRVERAKKTVPNARILETDINNFAANEKFDVILLNQVIEHIKDDTSLLVHLKSILTNKGVLIVGTTNEGSFLQQYMLRKTGAFNITDHIHFYTEKEIVKKIRNSGFRIEKIMREVFYPGNDKLYYWLTARRIGFMILEFLAWLFPSQCSDYYFECRLE